MILNTGYEVLIIGGIAATIAQIVKFFMFLGVNRQINFKCLTTAGGMPSSHSAGVISVAVTIGLITGFDSIEFALATSFSLIVMYDAAGVRRAAGKIAATLNKIKDEFYKHNTAAAGERLKELLGHTPFEVFAGALLGMVCAYSLHMCFLYWNI